MIFGECGSRRICYSYYFILNIQIYISYQGILALELELELELELGLELRI